MVGRPTKLTSATHRAIVDAVSAGMPLAAAARAAGIDESTLHHWVRRGNEEGEGPFFKFSQDIACAREQGERQLLDDIRTATVKFRDGSEAPDWRARAWLLERTRPERYSQNAQVQLKVSQELEGAVDRLRAALDPDTFRRVLGVLAVGSDSGEAVGGSEPASK